MKDGIHRFFRSLAITLETSERAKWSLHFGQLLLAMSGFLYGVFPEQRYYFAASYMVFAVTIAAWALLILIFYKSYGLNILIYRREHGMLLDKNLRTPNVALRRRTVSSLLNGFLDPSSGRSDQLRNAGREVGRTFVEDYRTFARARGSLEPKALLQELMEYDSSSGMGKFQESIVSDNPKMVVEVKVVNPFTDDGSGRTSHEFLFGYLEGLCKSIFEINFQARPGAIVPGQFLSVVIEEIVGGATPPAGSRIPPTAA